MTMNALGSAIVVQIGISRYEAMFSRLSDAASSAR